MAQKVTGRQKEFELDKVKRIFQSGLTDGVYLVNAAEVEVKLITGEVVTGELKECGAFALVVMVGKDDLILYKHAIVSIRVLTRL